MTYNNLIIYAMKIISHNYCRFIVELLYNFFHCLHIFAIGKCISY